MSSGGLRKQFQCSYFGFGYECPKLFVLPECGPGIFQAVWTTLTLLYHIAWLTYATYVQVHDDTFNDSYYFTRMSNWCYIVLTIFNLADVIVTVYSLYKKRDMVNVEKGKNFKMPWYLQITWFLFELNNTIAITMTIIYYSFVKTDDKPFYVEYNAINSVYVILNFFICGKPVRLLHFVYPLMYWALFVMFSVLFQEVGNNAALYDVIDWDDLSTAITYVLVVGLIGIPFIHVSFFALHKLRIFVRKSCCNAYSHCG